MVDLLRLNEHLARLSKQPVIVINVFICLLLNIPIGLLYHKLLHPKKVPPSVRHLVGLLLGLGIGWVCLKSELFILIAICLLCYMLTCTVHPSIVHKVVFPVSFTILIAGQIYRMIESYGTNHFDYTGRFMLIFLRLTYVSFSVHDGNGRNEKELNAWQNTQKIQKLPNVLEYFAYIFHFSGFLVGPCYTYREYIEFIEGKDMERALAESKGHKLEPSPYKQLMKTLWVVPILFGVTVLISPKVPLSLNGDPTFIANTPFLLRCLYAWVSDVAIRQKYYLAFMLGEMALVSCGMGFSGYDENGNELWENARNINILNVEFPTSLKMVVDSWNVGAAKWLRRCVHERVPYQKAALTFIVSVLWHGVYPGYFLIATSGFLYQQISKQIRRAYGHVYSELSSNGQKWLMVLQIFVNIVLLTYVTLPFPLLTYDLGMQFWRSMYFFGHIVCGLGLVLLHILGKPKPKVKEHVTMTTESQKTEDDISKKSEVNGFRYYNNNASHLRNPHFKGS